MTTWTIIRSLREIKKCLDLANETNSHVAAEQGIKLLTKLIHELDAEILSSEPNC